MFRGVTTPLKEFRGVTTPQKKFRGVITPLKEFRGLNTPLKVFRSVDCRAQGGGRVRSRRGSEGSTYTLVELPPVLIGTRVGSPLIFGVHADFGLDNVGAFLGPF